MESTTLGTTDTKEFEILLAEDNAADVDLVRLALRKHQVPCTLHVARDGTQAIEMIENLGSDPKAPALNLCIVDVHLPRRDGEEILKHLRSTDQYAQTPVIVMSGLDSQALGEQARDAALAYFCKPSTVDEYLELGSIVNHLLRKNGGRA